MTAAIKSFLLIAGFAAAFAGGGPFLPRAGATNPPQASIGQTVEVTRSHGRCWFPSIHRFRSGALLVTLSLSPDQRNAEGVETAYCVSRDGGASWSRRYTMGAEAGGSWTEAPDQGDMLWRFGGNPEPCQPGDTTRFYSSLGRYSRDGRGISIDRDRIMAASEPVYFAPVSLYDYHFDGKSPVADSRIKSEPNFKTFGNIVRADGVLYCCAYYISAADAQRYDNPRTHFRDVLLRSLDGGLIWSEYSTIAAVPDRDRPDWMGREGPTEGSLAVLADRRLYAVYRTGGDALMGQAWSADGGKIWTAPASIGFKGVAPRLHFLHDGTLALITGRPGPVVLRLNPDGTGRAWSRPIVIFTGMSTRYADFVEIQPGRVLVVYDSIPYGWHDIPPPDRDARNRILATFVDIRSTQ